MRQRSFIIIIAAIASTHLIAGTKANVPCPFNGSQTCTLYKNILQSQEPIILPVELVNNRWLTSEINTRYNNNSSLGHENKTAIHKSILNFSTHELKHGYFEIELKLPKCEVSDDGLCQANSNPQNYSQGLHASIFMLPYEDSNWPQNGEIDILEAYQIGPQSFNHSSSSVHFNGFDPACGGYDCKFIGFTLNPVNSKNPLYNDFHTWGFEWQPDPKSSNGGVIITEYFDHKKIWGPLTTDKLPADGANALRRGFQDLRGGFYFNVSHTVGDNFTGNPNPHLRKAMLYIKSMKTYSVNAN